MYAKRLILPIFLSILTPVYAIQISEIMYNPSGSDSSREWIEIYNNDSDTYNITGWKLNTGGSDHGLNVPPANGGRGSMVIAPNEYFIIAQDAGYFVSNFSFNGTVIDSSWQDLSNSANETVWIKNSTVVFHSLTSQPLAAEGNSTCMVNGSLVECVPTPGAANVLNQSSAANFTSNATNAPCNLSVDVNISKQVFGAETINYKILLNNSCVPTNVSVYSTIEDVSGNAVRSFSFTQELSCFYASDRQWTPDEITGTEAYYITANITSHSCNDTYAGDNYASKIIAVKGLPKAEPYLKIEKLSVGSDNEIAYGEAGEARITAYRGNSSMNAADVYVHNGSTKLSFVTNFNLNTRFANNTISVPVLMKPNCDGALPAGTFTLSASGLGVTDSVPIKVSGISSDACKTITKAASSSSQSSSSSSGGTPTKEEPEISIIKYDYVAPAGGEISTMVNITTSVNKSFAAYSYVFKNNEPVSLGYDGEKWLGTFDANRVEFDMEPGSRIVELRNRIEDVDSGEYSLRVRLKHNDVTKDVTKKIYVERTEPPQAGNVTENTNVPEPAPPEKETKSFVRTGMASISETKAFFLPHYVLYFLSSLFPDKNFTRLS